MKKTEAQLKSQQALAELVGRGGGFGAYVVMSTIYPTQPNWSFAYMIALMLASGRIVGTGMAWRQKVDS